MKQKKIPGITTSFDMSIGDLMAALLLIFILLLVSTLLKLQKDFELKSNIAHEYRRVQHEIFEDLKKEFSIDMEKWGAEIDLETLSIRFKNPEQLFLPNSAELRPAFRRTLEDFFPRYIKVLYPKYIESIEEIRIEGHTAQDFRYTYLNHMDLSQARTNEVLRHILGYSLTGLPSRQINWVQSQISASGFAYSKPVYVNGQIDVDLSRRVEFRIRTNSEAKIQELLDIGKEQ